MLQNESTTFRASDVTPMRNPETERLAQTHRSLEKASHKLFEGAGQNPADREAYNRAADEFANAIRAVANAESDTWVTVTAGR